MKFVKTKSFQSSKLRMETINNTLRNIKANLILFSIPLLCFGAMFISGMYMGYLNKWFGFEIAVVIGILTITLEVYMMKKYGYL